jgi:hypothetical protein
MPIQIETGTLCKGTLPVTLDIREKLKEQIQRVTVAKNSRIIMAEALTEIERLDAMIDQ